MKITVRYDDLTSEKTLASWRVKMLIARIKMRVKEVSFSVERGIKTDMPVDTGRARASWGHWTPGALRSTTLTSSEGGKEKHTLASISGNEATPSDAHWQVIDDGYAIEQGSNVEYIGELNDGHSAKAPAGFIDRREEEGRQALEWRLDQDLFEFTQDDR